MPCFLTALSNIKGVSLFFCGYIRLRKSNSRANCCQGCQGIAFILPSSSHRHCHDAVKAKKAKGSIIDPRYCQRKHFSICIFYILFLSFSYLASWKTIVNCLGVWSGPFLYLAAERLLHRSQKVLAPRRKIQVTPFPCGWGSVSLQKLPPPHNFLSFFFMLV